MLGWPRAYNKMPQHRLKGAVGARCAPWGAECPPPAPLRTKSTAGLTLFSKKEVATVLPSSLPLPHPLTRPHSPHPLSHLNNCACVDVCMAGDFDTRARLRVCAGDTSTQSQAAAWPRPGHLSPPPPHTHLAPSPAPLPLPRQQLPGALNTSLALCWTVRGELRALRFPAWGWAWLRGKPAGGFRTVWEVGNNPELGRPRPAPPHHPAPTPTTTCLCVEQAYTSWRTRAGSL